MHYYKKNISIFISDIFWNSFLPVLSLLLSRMKLDMTLKRIYISKLVSIWLQKDLILFKKSTKMIGVPQKDIRANMILKSSHIIGEKKWNRVLIWVRLPYNLQHFYRLSILSIWITFANYNLFFPTCCLSLNFPLLAR